MILRAEKIKAEIEQIFVDASHWNRIHPDEEPIDPDPDGKMKECWHYCDEVITKFNLKVQ